MKKRTVYICKSCNSKFPKWHGQCPNCKSWGTLQETVVDKNIESDHKEVKYHSLTSISVDKNIFLSSGSKIVDQFLGQGLIPGSVILLGGEPGIGKSTFLLQLMSAFCKNNKKALYISGEESLEQIKQRADRLGIREKNLYVANANSLDEILALLSSFEKDSLVAIDSVQTIVDLNIDGIAGSISQVKAVSSKLIEATKKRKIITILVSHVTKEGQIAGPKLMEHMVDVVLYLEGDKQYQFRILKSFKNRYGSSENILVLSMTEKGLKIVDNPTTFFLKARNPETSGTALAMTVEGQWSFAIEIQALVIKSSLSFPKRYAVGFDLNRLHLLLAVIEKKLGLSFTDKDVYLKIGSGLKLNDPGLDLGVTTAIISSYLDKPTPEKAIFWGEVDLNGQIRPSFKENLRLFHAKNLKYNPIVCAVREEPRSDVEIQLSTISELIDILENNKNKNLCTSSKRQ